MEQSSPCARCKKTPEDILMLSCGHDLCLFCAAERLSIELRRKKRAQCLQCQICSEITDLDAESIDELTKLIPQPSQRAIGRQADMNKNSRFSQDSQYRTNSRQLTNSGVSNQLMTGVSSRKNCNEHIDEDILYFCFSCKCECICPQCVIHGKHKDHEVKTIKKSHPIIKDELQSAIDKIESSIQTLTIKRNEVDKNFRILNEQNNQSKRQIQQAFDEIRQKLDFQQRQVLSKCDLQLHQALQELDKSTKSIVKRIQELKLYSTAAVQFMKKDQQTMLNFYAKKWKQISEWCKEQPVYVTTVSLPSNQNIMGDVTELSQIVENIGSSSALHMK